MEHMISLVGVAKKYKAQDEYAVRDVSFCVDQGEIVGILGPNGAGKSTLIKLLLGVIRPTDGRICVLGKEPLRFSKRDKAKLGVFLGGKTNLIFHLPVMDSVRLFQSIYKVPQSVFERNLERYGALLQCDSFLRQRVATLSLGQRLRAELLCILIYEPRLLILDEPTLGLDIEGKRQFRDMLQELVSRQGLSVLITTHDVNDMQKLCSRILMICKGEKVMDLTSAEFDALLGQHCVILTDHTLDTLPDGTQFLERENSCNRYLVPARWAGVVRREIERHPYHILKQEMPRLEDILYEYYR